MSTCCKWEHPDINKQSGHFPHFEDEITRKTGEPIFIDTPSIENTYYAVCALGLKQLAKHARPIGFLNKDGQFNGLIAWFGKAAEEHFITEKCLQLFDVDEDEKNLREVLKDQAPVHIDLHKEKWGERREAALLKNDGSRQSLQFSLFQGYFAGDTGLVDGIVGAGIVFGQVLKLLLNDGLVEAGQIHRVFGEDRAVLVTSAKPPVMKIFHGSSPFLR